MYEGGTKHCKCILCVCVMSWYWEVICCLWLVTCPLPSRTFMREAPCVTVHVMCWYWEVICCLWLTHIFLFMHQTHCECINLWGLLCLMGWYQYTITVLFVYKTFLVQFITWPLKNPCMANAPFLLPCCFSAVRR